MFEAQLAGFKGDQTAFTWSATGGRAASCPKTRFWGLSGPFVWALTPLEFDVMITEDEVPRDRS